MPTPPEVTVAELIDLGRSINTTRDNEIILAPANLNLALVKLSMLLDKASPALKFRLMMDDAKLSDVVREIY